MTALWIAMGILLCLVLSAFFSASEMAYSACNQLRLESEAAEGSTAARVALRIRKRFDHALSAILIGNNIVNLSASALATTLAMRVWGEPSVALATGILTILVLIFGEITPKTMAAVKA